VAEVWDNKFLWSIEAQHANGKCLGMRIAFYLRLITTISCTRTPQILWLPGCYVHVWEYWHSN